MTPEQRQEELSRAYLHAVAAKCGFALGNWTQDQSCIDVTVGAAGVLGGGSLADPKLDVQLKCTANQTLIRQDHVALQLTRPQYERLIAKSFVPRPPATRCSSFPAFGRASGSYALLFSAVVRELTLVEHVMSVASDDGAMLVVQFKAGVPQDLALAAPYERLAANGELLPPGAPFPVVKARGVEDVPVLVMSIWDERDDPAVLRRLAGELRASLLQLPGVSRAEILGGSQRTLSVQLDASKLAGRGLAAERVAQAVQAANVRLPSGTVSGPGGVFRVQAGGLVESAADLEALIVGATASGPVYLRDVATVADGVPESRSYVAHFVRGPLRA